MPLFNFNAKRISTIHSLCAASAFSTALLVGIGLHYKSIVRNHVAGYPDEWLPSVSSTIGDWYPERSLFHILIALSAGPRFLLVLLQFCIAVSSFPNSALPAFTLASGILRTVSCGGWVYISSTDHSMAHDILMISYIVLNIPWFIGCIKLSVDARAKSRRKFVAGLFFGAIPPMVWLYIRHKVQLIPGAYTRYAFFEWFLIGADVYFDSCTKWEFEKVQITISSSEIGSDAKDISQRNPAFEKAAAHAVKTTVPRSEQHGIRASDPNIPVPPSSTVIDSLSFTADVYFAYVWWTLQTALPLSLFYYSVWSLAISGAELTFISLLSPFFLSINFIDSAARSKTGKVTLKALEIACGLGAYRISNVGWRLIALSIGIVFGVIGQAVHWRQSLSNGNANVGVVFVLGFVMSSVSRLLGDGNNPLWPILDERSGGWNKIGLAFAVLCLIEFATRSSTSGASSASKKQARSLSYVAPIGLGAAIFALHSLFASPTTMIKWNWTGFPVSGPVTQFTGVRSSGAEGLVVLAMASGAALSLLGPDGLSKWRSNIVTSPFFIALGPSAVYVFYAHRDWVGFSGGLLYATWLCAAVPTLITSTALHSEAGGTNRSAGVVWLTYIVLTLADVWTVAYAFVPGGPAMRERTGLVLVVEVSMIVIGLFTTFSPGLNPTKRSDTTGSRSLKTRVFTTCTILALTPFIQQIILPSFQADVPHPHKSVDRLVTAGIWTVHFGIDLEGRDSQRRITNLVRDMQLDILGLLETDLDRIVFGNRDLTKVLARDLGYYVDTGPGPNSHTWGAILLSKFPIINSTHHLLPSPDGELAPAISAVLDIWGTNVMVVVSHNGQDETPVDRQLQAQELGRIMAQAYPMPTIFLGYVVTKPHAPKPAPYQYLVTDGRMHDIDKEDHDRWCEYILYRGLYRTGYARVSRSNITDTELQIGKFIVPKFGKEIFTELESEEQRYLRGAKEDLPQSWWFNDSYYGNEQWGGVRGHFYHVFDGPLYYRIPEGVQL